MNTPKVKRYKTYTPSAETLLGEHGWHYLPAYMNKRGILTSHLLRLQLTNHPEMLKMLLLKAAKSDKVRENIKNLCKLRGFRSLQQVRRVVHESGVDTKDIKKVATDIVEQIGLYDDDNQVVKAKQKAAFSYGGYYEYDHQLSQHRDVRCPNCDKNEHVNTYDNDYIEEVLERCENYETVIGPYVSCKNCEKVIRPIISEATGLSDNDWSDSYGEWEQHKDNLEELGDALTKHATDAGYPKTEYLMVSGDNLDWRGRSGWTMTRSNELAKAMSVNSDFCLGEGKLWVPSNGLGYLSARLSHHDVPMGGRLTVYPAWYCELLEEQRYQDEYDEDAIIAGDDIVDAIKLGDIATRMLCGAGNFFDYAGNQGWHKFEVVSKKGLTDALDEQLDKLPEIEGDPADCFEALAVMVRNEYMEVLRLIRSGDADDARMRSVYLRLAMQQLIDEVERREECEPAVIIFTDDGAIGETFTSIEGLRVIIIDNRIEFADKEYIYKMEGMEPHKVTDIEPEYDAYLTKRWLNKKDACEPSFVGTVIRGTNRPDDLFNPLASLYKQADRTGYFEYIKGARTELGDALFDSNHKLWEEHGHEVINELVDRLNRTAPEGFYFGTHTGDMSDYGFWRVPDNNAN